MAVIRIIHPAFYRLIQSCHISLLFTTTERTTAFNTLYSNIYLAKSLQENLLTALEGYSNRMMQHKKEWESQLDTIRLHYDGLVQSHQSGEKNVLADPILKEFLRIYSNWAKEKEARTDIYLQKRVLADPLFDYYRSTGYPFLSFIPTCLSIFDQYERVRKLAADKTDHAIEKLNECNTKITESKNRLFT